MSPYFVPPATYLRRWDHAMSPTDHELVVDHTRCQGFWPECERNGTMDPQTAAILAAVQKLEYLVEAVRQVRDELQGIRNELARK